MPKPLLPALLLLLLPITRVYGDPDIRPWCSSNTPHPIDVAFAEAIERSGGVTVEMRDAQGEAYAAWDALLNRHYRALMKLAGDSRAARLRTAQRAWLAFDAAQTQWDLALQADAGTAGPLSVADAGIARRRARVCELETDLESLREE